MLFQIYVTTSIICSFLRCVHLYHKRHLKHSCFSFEAFQHKLSERKGSCGTLEKGVQCLRIGEKHKPNISMLWKYIGTFRSFYQENFCNMLLPLGLVKWNDSWRRIGCCCSSGHFRQDPPAWSSVIGCSWNECCCRSQMRQCLGSGRTASGHCRWRSRSGPELTDHASNRSDSLTSCD